MRRPPHTLPAARVGVSMANSTLRRGKWVAAAVADQAATATPCWPHALIALGSWGRPVGAEHAVPQHATKMRPAKRALLDSVNAHPANHPTPQHPRFSDLPQLIACGQHLGGPWEGQQQVGMVSLCPLVWPAVGAAAAGAVVHGPGAQQACKAGWWEVQWTSEYARLAFKLLAGQQDWRSGARCMPWQRHSVAH